MQTADVLDAETERLQFTSGTIQSKKDNGTNNEHWYSVPPMISYRSPINSWSDWGIRLTPSVDANIKFRLNKESRYIPSIALIPGINLYPADLRGTIVLSKNVYKKISAYTSYKYATYSYAGNPGSISSFGIGSKISFKNGRCLYLEGTFMRDYESLYNGDSYAMLNISYASEKSIHAEKTHGEQLARILTIGGIGLAVCGFMGVVFGNLWDAIADISDIGIAY
jgi:hypothetical protein